MSEQPAAPRNAFESFFDNLISELDDSRFFWPDDRKTTMVETMRNAFVRGRFTMGEISLIRGAMRSLVEGPRRRAVESDSQRARALFDDWLMVQDPAQQGQVSDFVHAGDLIVARLTLKHGQTGAWFVRLEDWKIGSAQFVGSYSGSAPHDA